MERVTDSTGKGRREGSVKGNNEGGRTGSGGNVTGSGNGYRKRRLKGYGNYI